MLTVTQAMVRIDQPEGMQRLSRSRLNLLLSCAERREDPVMDQLPRLLAPMGINSIRASSGEGAARIISDCPIHIAVVDLLVPLVEDPSSAAGGPRILQLLRRLDQPPPTVVIRPRQAVARESARGLAAALREGAFAVLDQPIHLEALLEVMRRIIHRHYADLWPA
jgi:DNA-binding NtrC family response regulator